MPNPISVSYKQISNALQAFGYQSDMKGSHVTFRHPQGRLLIILPRARDNALASRAHVKVVQATIRDDGVVSSDDFEFYLKHNKMPKDVIVKGDKLLWSAPHSRSAILVEAAAGEKDGLVIIKQKGGVFSPCPVEQLRKI